MSPVIKIESLCKSFVHRKTEPGVGGALKGLFFSKNQTISAIINLSLSIEKGERIAFIGPNGAGKSTTIKILTGILHPTSGTVKVLGLVPWKARKALGYKIGCVFGQRSQLWYHLPPIDTFHLLSKIYEIDQKAYKARLEELTTLFELIHLLDKPVRQLSLGERMRCEIVASLLHRPEILFLDEPTIGLDINAKLMIRGLLNKLSKDHGTTLFLTSHDTADIEQVSDRVIVLNQGELVADSNLRDLKSRYMRKKILTLVTDEEHFELRHDGIRLQETAPYQSRYEVDLDITTVDSVISEAIKAANLKDISLEDPSMEEVIRILYG